MAKDKPALIIMHYDMSATPEEVQEAKQGTAYEKLTQKTDKNSQNILVCLEAVKACARPKPPLIWLSSIYNYVCDDKERIKDLMRGSKDFNGCDLITDYQCVAGIEVDLVILLGKDAR